MILLIYWHYILRIWNYFFLQIWNLKFKMLKLKRKMKFTTEHFIYIIFIIIYFFMHFFFRNNNITDSIITNTSFSVSWLSTSFISIGHGHFKIHLSILSFFQSSNFLISFSIIFHFFSFFALIFITFYILHFFYYFITFFSFSYNPIIKLNIILNYFC